MKKYLLSILFFTLLIWKGALSQTMQFTKDAEMSCFMGDWDKYGLLKIRLFNSGNQTTVGARTSLYKDDTLILYTDSNLANLPLLALSNPYSDYSFNQLCNYDNAIFVSNMMNEYETSGKLLEGNYKIVVQFSAFSLFGLTLITDSTTFHVSPYLSAGLITPYNNAHIYNSSNVKNMVNFVWYPAYVSSQNTAKYFFYIKPLNAGQTEEEAWANNSSLIYHNSLNTSYTPTSAEYQSLSSGNYIWGVETKDNVFNNTSLGNNRGRSEIFKFTITDNPGDVEILQRQSNNQWCQINEFELNSLEGWQGYKCKFDSPNTTFNNYKDTFAVNVYDSMNARVTNGYTEGYLTDIDKAPGGGTHSMRYSFGHMQAGQTDDFADLVKYSYTIKDNNTMLNMSSAVIVEWGPDHTDAHQSRVRHYIHRGKLYSPWDEIYDRMYLPLSTDPALRVSKLVNTVFVKDWDCMKFDFSKRQGQLITIEAFGANCERKGHIAYGYMDFCVDIVVTPSLTCKDIYCMGDSLNIDASATTNERNYFISMKESDQSWGRNPKTEIYKWFSGQAGKYDLRNLISDPLANPDKLVLKCNTYYRVKIAAVNGCSNWNEIVKLIYISCPAKGLAGPDKCCDQLPIILGTTGIPTYTYQWQPTQYLAAPTLSLTQYNPPQIPPPYPRSYYLYVTDTNNCTTKDTVQIYCTVPNCSVIYDTFCSNRLYTNCANYSELMWEISDHMNNGSINHYTLIGDTINFNPAENYAVIKLTVKSPCQNLIINNITIHKKNTKAFEDTILIYQFQINENNPIIFYDNSLTGTPHSFSDAKAWRIRALDRWGQLPVVAQGTGTVTDGIRNGEIRWGGTALNGEPYEDNVILQLTLELKPCSGEEWVTYTYCWHIYEGKCKEYYRPWWAGFCRICKTWETGYFNNQIYIPVQILR